ncbi:MAG TPA: M28 family peptidase [Blastocatellia bacterium]|nr:M28 family peptidase [Blastocatellia bacterium]
MLFRKAGLFIFTIALLIGTSALALNPATIGFAPSLYAKTGQRAAAASQLSAERVAKHVQFLASDKLQGRRAGTPFADEAAVYVEKEFRSYGLKPASAAGFRQPFTFVSAVKLGEQNRFILNAANGPRSLKVGEEFMPLAFSSPDPVSGEVAFAGYGISAPALGFDSYSGIDPKGKIVVILRGSPDGDNPHGKFAEFTQPGLEIQNKTLKAREKGARGVVFVSGEKSFHEDRLSRLRHDLNFLDSGIPTAIVSRDAAASILASVGSSLADAETKAKEPTSALAIKGVTAQLKTDVVKINGTSANVVGVLPGSDPQLASEYVVIGAHYDHLGLGGPESLAAKPEGQIHHGADDNASGTTGLLEIARVLASERGKIKRSIMFIAFSGEELGLLGSGAYTKNPVIPLATTVAMLNMDMIGRLRNGSLFVGGVGTSPAWKPLLEKLNGAAQATASAAGNASSSRFQLGFGEDGFGPSDHQSFYVRDVPVLFFFTGTHDDYHKPSDTADKINGEGLKQVAEFVREIAVSVANEPQRIAFTKVKAELRSAGRGFRVYLGTVPNYSDQSDGMKLDGVRPGSPAEKAGMRAGDIVLKLGKMPIKNVYDYTYALGEMRGGEEVEVVIRRDGKEMTMKITPEKRQ